MAKKRSINLNLFIGLFLGFLLVGFVGAVVLGFVGTTTNTFGNGAIAEPNNITHLLPSTNAPYNSLVAYYSFDADEYPDKTTNGKIGKGLNFNIALSQIVNFGTSGANLHPTSNAVNYTWIGWVNVQSLNGTTNSYIFSRYGSNGGFNIGLDNGATTAVKDGNFWVWWDNGAGAAIFLDGGTNYEIGNWTQIAVTYSGAGDDKFRFYKNGVLTNTSATASDYNPAVASAITMLGRYSADNLGLFNGTMDEIKIFNRTLESTEIANIYGNESLNVSYSSLNRTGLVAEYRMNFSKANAILDTTSDFYPGTLNGYGTYSTLDFTNNNNDGTYVNQTHSSNLNSIYDDYAVFNGVGDYINIPANTLMNFGTKNFTFSLWIKSLNNNDFGSFTALLDNYGAGGIVGQAALFINKSGSLWFYTAQAVEVYTPWTAQSVADTNWHYVVATRTNGNLTVYIDGVPSASVNGSIQNIGSNSQPWRVGWYQAAGANGMNATLDEIMIFNSSLNSSQVLQIYNNQSQRFNPSGIATIKFQNITADGNNTINLSVSILEKNYNTNVSARIGSWNISNGYDNTNASLVAYYHADIGANDSSGNGNEGVISGAVINGLGQFNNSLNFDGINDYVDLPSSARIDWRNGGTKSAWFKVGGLHDYTLNIIAGAVGGADDNICGMAVGGPLYNPGKVYATCRLSGTNFVVMSTRTVNDNQWHQVSIAWDGTTGTNSYKLYLDGVLDNSSTPPAVTGAEVTGPCIGAYARDVNSALCDYSTFWGSFPDGSFNGSIDEVMIWNKTLSAQEISELYTKGRIANVGLNWTYTNYTNISSINTQYRFPIPSWQTHLYPEFRSISNNNSFYSPMFGGNISLILWAILDTISPSISLNALNDNINTSLTNIVFNFTAIEDSNSLMSCSLYIDSVLQMTNSSVSNNTLTNLNASGISGGNRLWNVSCTDSSGNSNTSATRSFYVDLYGPVISNILHYPNDSGIVDPNTNVTFNATVVDNRVNVSSVILQVNNGTSWFNTSMNRVGSTNVYTTNVSLIGINSTYSYNIYANDSFGNVNISSNVTFASVWDCTWNVTSPRSISSGGFNQNKLVDYINISNTGDAQYPNNNCTLSFQLAHNISAGRIYFNQDPNNEFISSYLTGTIAAKGNVSLPLNATFLSTTENLYSNIETRDLSGRSTSDSSVNVTLNLVSSSAAYLTALIDLAPNNISLTYTNFSLSGYVRNIVGNATLSAENVTFNWTLPDGFLIKDGNVSINISVLNTTIPNYNRINISFNDSNLEDLIPGTYTLYVYAYGYNRSGSLIEHANNQTIISYSTIINLNCYNQSDGILVTSCGSLDGDYVAPSTSSGTASGGGGGGGGGAGIALKTVVDYSLIRGKQNEIEVPFTNRDANLSLRNIKFTVSGGISRYISLEPESYELLGAGQTINVKLKINSPTYIPLGIQKITLNIKGTLGGQEYNENKEITLKINEISEGDAGSLIGLGEELISKFKENGFTDEEIDKLLAEMKVSLAAFNYEQVTQKYNELKKKVESAIDAKGILGKLNLLFVEANDKGIDTSNSERLAKLAQLSLDRGDYEEAYLRAKEAQATYAAEIKGELAKLSYYLRTNRNELMLGALFLSVLSFAGYRLGKYNWLRNKIRSLNEEERILNDLIKLTQQKTFKENKMDMEEYYESISQYEKKLADIIEMLIDMENQKEHILYMTSKLTSLQEERRRLFDLIKELQYDYMKRKKVDSRVYDLKLQSFNRRVGEVDSKLAEIEAKSALRRFKL